MKFKEVNICQNTEEWKIWRSQRITASDVAKIVGKSTYGNLWDVYQEKVEFKQKFITDAMKRGTMLEPIARSFLSQRHQIEYKPMCVESLQYPFLGASMDAVSPNYKRGAEIKCVGEASFKKAIEGNYLPDYSWQCQAQMANMDWDEIVLFFYFNDFINKEFIIKRDQKMIDELLKKSEAFYINHLITRIEPAKIGDDYLHIIDDEATALAKLWKTYDEAEKIAKEYKDKIADDLLSIANEQDIFFPEAQLKIKYCERKGTVDYKQVCKTWHITDEDLEKYRKESSKYPKFSIIN